MQSQGLEGESKKGSQESGERVARLSRGEEMAVVGGWQPESSPTSPTDSLDLLLKRWPYAGDSVKKRVQ